MKTVPIPTGSLDILTQRLSARRNCERARKPDREEPDPAQDSANFER
ncbi:hypothetical protein [Caulobacter sp. DWR1-3-2b1]